MSTIIRDLWPDDIKADDVIAPAEILRYQAEQLEHRTNGLLSPEVESIETEDRIAMGFEIVVARTGERARLFGAQHRLDYEYPVAILPPQEEKLPEFLRDRVFKPSTGEVLRSLTNLQQNAMAQVAGVMGSEGRWVENEWIATSPTEFTEYVGKVLSLPSVKAVVLSLLARANRSSPDDND